MWGAAMMRSVAPMRRARRKRERMRSGLRRGEGEGRWVAARVNFSLAKDIVNIIIQVAVEWGHTV